MFRGIFLAMTSLLLCACERAAVPVPGEAVERRFITADGVERSYLLRLPQGYRGGPADVVFNFHGATSNMWRQLEFGDFRALADRDGVILVLPDANIRFPDREEVLAEYWDSAWEANLRVRDDDLEFVLQLLEKLADEFGIDRAFATGMSSGGDMVSALQCLTASPFEAYAPVTYLYFDASECDDASAAPLLYFHGDADQVVPIEGSGPPWNDPPVRTAMARWAAHNGCAGAPTEMRVGSEVLHYVWRDCAAATEWYLIEGGGHNWPGGMQVDVLGHTTQQISASELIWRFFFSPGAQH